MTWLHHHPGRPVARLPVFQTDLGHKNPQRLYIKVVSCDQLQPCWSQTWNVSGEHGGKSSRAPIGKLSIVFQPAFFRGKLAVKLGWCIPSWLQPLETLRLGGGEFDRPAEKTTINPPSKPETDSISRASDENSGRFVLNCWTILSHIAIDEAVRQLRHVFFAERTAI